MGRTWFACDQMSPGSSEQEQYVRLRIFKCFVLVSHVASRVLREGSGLRRWFSGEECLLTMLTRRSPCNSCTCVVVSACNPALGGRGWADPGGSLASQPSRNDKLQIQQETTFQGKKLMSDRTGHPMSLSSAHKFTSVCTPTPTHSYHTHTWTHKHTHS